MAVNSCPQVFEIVLTEDFNHFNAFLKKNQIGKPQFLFSKENVYLMTGPSEILKAIANFEKNVAEHILAEKNRHGEFSSLENFMKRVSISVEQLRILIRIGAFRFTGKTKKQFIHKPESPSSRLC